jgi:hypothetical protein
LTFLFGSGRIEFEEEVKFYVLLRMTIVALLAFASVASGEYQYSDNRKITIYHARCREKTMRTAIQSSAIRPRGNCLGKLLFCIPVWLLFMDATPGLSMFLSPAPAPAERLIRNTEAYISEHQEDPQGYYILGRLHYLAFINRIPWVRGTHNPASLPQLPPDWLVRKKLEAGDISPKAEAELEISTEMGYSSFREMTDERDRKKFWEGRDAREKELEAEGWKCEELKEQELFEHARLAILNLRKAIEMAPENALYWLGLASLVEQYAGFLRESGRENPLAEYENLTPDSLRDAYYKAYKLAIAEDSRLTSKPMSGLPSLVGYEAGKAYLRLAEAEESLSLRDRWRRFVVNYHLERLEGLSPAKVVTPIVFSVVAHDGLEDLLAPAIHVPFDLDGDDVIELWPWVRPTTGILVWDPERTGVITSGRELFGSVSWWLFFTDGYHSLDALDDNRDGQLFGEELEGISVWFDRNSNGISDYGEVLPIQETGILSVATSPDSQSMYYLMNRTGIVLEDGRRLATYDWITAPIQ